MNQQPPKLRRHKNGQYFVRYAGKDHYLGRDHVAANREYLNHLKIWASWRERRNERRLPPLRSADTMERAINRFLENRLLEGGQERCEFYRKHLKRFQVAFGNELTDTVRPKWVQFLKDDMMRKGYAPRTINHDLQAVKTMLQWSADLEHMPAINLRGIKKLPLGEVENKSLPLRYVKQIVFSHHDWRLTPWLAINYLCAMRPSEVVRLVNGDGAWERRGVWKMYGKTTAKTKISRRVLFSAEALSWLRHAEPVWSRLDSYSLAVRNACGIGPHMLRHSAGTHLMQSGVARSDADEILGHYPARVSVTYMQPRWPHLRCLMGRISLRTR